jgi:predicted O-methyltransferase YrrM
MTNSKSHSVCTLTTPRVAALLARVFAEVADNDGLREQVFASLPREEVARLFAGTDYRELYGKARELYLAVSPETARLLYMLARTISAKAMVEFGTSFGVSTIHLAAALRDNGGGRLIGSEFEPTKIERARANLREAGLDDLVDIREGDALETLARDLPESIDLVLLDGHKPLYPQILDRVEPRLRAGACLVADNAKSSPEYLARVRQAGGGYLSVPFADDVELSIRL